MRLLLASFLLVSAVTSLADDERRSDGLSHWVGAFEFGFTLEGELQDCNAPPPGGVPRLVIRSTYAKLAGVCDDQSERPCAGRITRLFERCIADDVNYPLAGGGLTNYIRAKIRICFDESAQGNCDDVDEVASGVALAFIPNDFFNNLSDDDPATFDAANISTNRDIIRKSKPFRLDGKRVRVPRGESIGDTQARFNNACLFEANACPIASTRLRQR